MGEGTVRYALSAIQGFLLPWGEGQDEGSEPSILHAAPTYSAGKYFSSTMAEANSILISRFSSERLSFSL
jgi:hypothetical protein